ncbi:uncharacterized protein cubi_00446 [Cryptosporidium ubiquitum]|uniref:Nucleoprotein TPR n=1 Tax=Cryptosporidium ubiquitum TaxID=857276 RepID=A0A1J4MG59_9CRYT|nr:uncharacterized protein cubi_00446 [Cryptosporidium ubiquitum]OII72451.1 hypothetical protein cubi_00446 [Cryptosporidium ubiquitum]
MEQGGVLKTLDKEDSSVKELVVEKKDDKRIGQENSDLIEENERLKLRIKELEEKFYMESLDEGGGDDRRNQVSVLTEQLVQERNENERLQENLSGLQESLVKSKKKLLEFQQKVYDSEIISSRSQHESKILEQEKNALQDSLKKYQEEAGVMENKIKELYTSKNNILLESTKKISDLEVSCRDFEHKIALIQKSRDELEMEYSKTCDELRRVKSDLDFAKGHYEGKIKIKEEAIRLKEEQVQQVQSLLDMSISTAQNLESEIEKLRSGITEEGHHRDEEILRGSLGGALREQSQTTGLNKFGGKQLTDKQALEILVKIFGETYILGEASSKVEDTLDGPEEGSGTTTSGGRRILIDLLTQLEDYQQSMDELRNQNQALKEDLKEFQYHLRVTVPDFELTREKFESLQAENNFAIQQIQSLTQERRTLIHEVSELKTLWQHEAKKREIYEEQCKMITQNFNRIINNTGAIDIFGNDLENQNSKFSTDLEMRRDLEYVVPENIGEREQIYENVIANKTMVEKMYSDIIEQNTQLKIQVSRLIEGIELDSQIQIRKLTSDIASYKDQFERIHNERDELVSQYQALISKLEEENNKLKHEKDLAKESIDKDDEGKREEGNIQSEKVIVGDPTMNPNIFVKQLGEVTEMCKTLSEKLTSEIESSTQCKSELSRYKAQCEYMESMGERNRKRLDELFEERDGLYMQLNDLRRQQDRKDSQVQELKDRISSKESEIMDLKRENEHQRQSISSLNACISDLRSDIEQGIKQRSQDNALQRDVISQLQGELEGKCVEINSMRKSQDAILQREFEESQRLRQQLRAEHDRYQGLESKIKDLQNEKENLERRLTEIENEVETKKNRLSSIGVFGLATSSPESSEIKSSVRNSINISGFNSNIGIEDMDEGCKDHSNIETEVSKLRVQLEESRKLQNYWKELVQSVEKQLETKTRDLEELRVIEENLKGELESRREEAKQMEEESQKELTRLNESISAMTLRISSIDEEIAKRESTLRENLSQVTEENLILKKETEELRQMEQDLRGQYQNIVRMHSLDIERLQNMNKQCIELKEELGTLRENSRKSDDENTNLVMEMQNDILHLRRQLESYTKKYETAKTDNINLREMMNKLKTEHQLPSGFESMLDMAMVSASLVEGGDGEEGNGKVSDERRQSIQSASGSGGSSSTNSSSVTASLLLMRKVQTLTSSVEELDTKLDESKIEIQRLTFERKSLREENEVLQRRLTEELERASEFASKAEANESTLIRLGELVTLRESNDRLRRELIQATERHSNLEKRLEQESRQSDPLRCEISKLEAQVENLKSLCEEKSALSRSWEEQYNRVLLNYENMNPNEISQMKEEISKLKVLNEELKDTLGTKTQEIEKLQIEKQQEHVGFEELQLTKQQMEQLRKVYMSTNQKLKEERNKCTRLENELKRLNSQTQTQTQTQPQIQVGVSSNLNSSNSQDGSNSNNNSQSYKPSSQEIKSISQATENLVSTVLKLAKLSILRMESEGVGGNTQTQSGSSSSSSLVVSPSGINTATLNTLNSNNVIPESTFSGVTSDNATTAALGNSNTITTSTSSIATTNNTATVITNNSSSMTDTTGAGATATPPVSFQPLPPPPPPPPPHLPSNPTQTQGSGSGSGSGLGSGSGSGSGLMETQTTVSGNSIPYTNPSDSTKQQRIQENSGSSSFFPAQKKRPLTGGCTETKETANQNNQENTQTTSST